MRATLPEAVPVLVLRCTLNNAPNSPMFTEDQTYTARHHRKRMYKVQDDRGHVRHLLIEGGRAGFPLGTESASPGARCYAAQFEAASAEGACHG